jgi:hypothetical protein
MVVAVLYPEAWTAQPALVSSPASRWAEKELWKGVQIALIVA